MDEFKTDTLQLLLESAYDQLTETAHITRKIYKARSFKLTKEAREFLGKKRSTLEELAELWLPLWNSQGRVSANGFLVRVPEPEATLLHIHEEVDIYTLCQHIGLLFIDETAACTEKP
jgi:hypothetical protein